MAKNRKTAEDVILKWVSKIDPSGINTAMYEKQIFPSMNDKQFDDWMNAIREGRDFVAITIPNFSKVKVTTKNNIALSKEMGVDFYQRIWVVDKETGKRYLSNIEYPVFYLPVRRQIQMVTSKISIASDNKHIDDLTDQPVGDSKAGSFSYPETLNIVGRGLNQVGVEFLKVRGGDLETYRVYQQSLIDTGQVSYNQLAPIRSRAKSTLTLSKFLKAMHIANNL